MAGVGLFEVPARVGYDRQQRVPESAYCGYRLDPDYGLDLTVEIFDREHHATGLSFQVQLKATDRPDLGIALKSIRFGRRLADYYGSLTLPVLVVLFHAPTEGLFARWFHAYNPHVAIRDRPGPVRKTIGFQLSEHDRWTLCTPDELEAGARGFVAFRSPELSLPLRFSLSIDADAVGHDLYRHLFALRSVLKRVSDVAVIEAGPSTPGQPGITLGRKGSVVSLADVASVTLDHDETALEDPESHAADLAVVIATVLARVGQSNLAAQVAAATAAASGAILDFHVTFMLAGAMARSRRVVEALHLAEALDVRGEQEEDGRLVAFVLQSAVLARGTHLSAEERRLAVVVGESALQRAEARDDARRGRSLLQPRHAAQGRPRCRAGYRGVPPCRRARSKLPGSLVLP